MEINMKYDVLIIGGGPAGLSAAIYLRRAMLTVAVVEKQAFTGGQMLLTGSIENYPGFESISGDELSEKFHNHAAGLGAQIIVGEVVSLDGKTAVLRDGRKISAKAVVLAMGSAHKRLGAKGEMKFSGRGVSYCATCDGAFFRNKDVAVIGGGDTALEDAIYLASMCSSVTIVHRRSELRAAKILQDKFLMMNNSDLIINDEVEEFCGENLLKSIKLKSGRELKLSGAFVAIGQSPQSDFMIDKADMDSEGYFVTDEYCMTSLDGVFAIGDIRRKNCRQIVTAVADGAIVSKGILNYL